MTPSSGPSPVIVRERRFELTTPEHVPIDFVLADLGSRFGALVLDLFFQILILTAIVFVAGSLLALGGSQGALTLLLFFLVRNFYFTACEVYGRGQTPGKRKLHLRVVARDGGPLETDQIFARNLTRDLEIFLPVTVLMAPEGLLPNAPGWAKLATAAWVLALGLLPFFNRQRARLGDLIAGTVVVVEPHGELEQDLVDLRGELATGRFAEYTFSREQLDVYGIRELQVLEDLLRRPPSDQKDKNLELVCEKILAKIGWDLTAHPVEPHAFLKAFYAAQRKRLEQKMLFGKRQERKVR